MPEQENTTWLLMFRGIDLHQACPELPDPAGALEYAGATKDDLVRMCSDISVRAAVMTVLWASRDPKGREQIIQLLREFWETHACFGSGW